MHTLAWGAAINQACAAANGLTDIAGQRPLRAAPRQSINGQYGTEALGYQLQLAV